MSAAPAGAAGSASAGVASAVESATAGPASTADSAAAEPTSGAGETASVADSAPVEPTTVVKSPAADPTTVVKGKPADPTTVVKSAPAKSGKAAKTPKARTKPPVVPAKTQKGAAEENATAEGKADEAQPAVPLARSSSTEDRIDEKQSDSHNADRGRDESEARDEDDVLAAAPVSPVAALNRPARPAWRPMEVRPVGPGVTVFGTRLTYRQAAIGAGIVLLVLTLIAILIVQAVADDEDAPTGAKPNGVPPAATPGATKPAPTQAATSAAPTTAAPTTAAPSTTPPSPSAPPSSPAGAALPAGWRLAKVPAGNGVPAMSVQVPAGARQSGSGAEVRFTWNNRLMLVGRTTDPKPDAYDDWVAQEANRRDEYSDYRKVRIDKVNWRGFPSVADWEYYYTTDNGNPQHVIRRNVVVGPNAAYSLNWYVSTEDWDAAKADLQAIYQGFQPK